jgi:hypothetical protein
MEAASKWKMGGIIRDCRPVFQTQSPHDELKTGYIGFRKANPVRDSLTRKADKICIPLQIMGTHENSKNHNLLLDI